MTSQYGAYALHAGKARLHARTRMYTLKRPCTHTHARTHRSIYNTYCFSTATIIRERASVLRCTYIACIVTSVYNLVGYHITTIVLQQL